MSYILHLEPVKLVGDTIIVFCLSFVGFISLFYLADIFEKDICRWLRWSSADNDSDAEEELARDHEEDENALDLATCGCSSVKNQDRDLWRVIRVRTLEEEWVNNKELCNDRHEEMQQLPLAHKASAREELVAVVSMPEFLGGRVPRLECTTTEVTQELYLGEGMGGSGRGEGCGKGQWAPDQEALSAPSTTQRTPSGHNLVTADEALSYLGQWSALKTMEQRQTQANLLIKASWARKLLLPSEADTEDALTDALHENTSKGLKHRVNHGRNLPGFARTKSRSHSPVRTDAAENVASVGQSSAQRSHSGLARVADSSRPYSLLPRSSSTSTRKPSPSRTRKLWCTAKLINVSSGNRFYAEVIRQQGRCPKRTLPGEDGEDGEALCVPAGLARVSSSTMSIRWTRTQSFEMNTAFTCTSVSYADLGDDGRVHTIFTRTKTAPG